jgi:hypothetical protein
LPKTIIEEAILNYYLEKAVKSDGVGAHVLKYCYRKIMPHLACLERHIVCLPIIFEYTAEDFINPVESLLGCADAEKLYF